MNVGKLVTEERAVTPVIAIVLMITITIILGAVIGAVVLGISNTTAEPPDSSFGFDFDGPNRSVTVEHRGGDRLTVGENTRRVDVIADDGTPRETWIGPGTTRTTVEPGDTNVYGYTEPGTTVRIVWVAPDNESSATMDHAVAPG